VRALISAYPLYDALDRRVRSPVGEIHSSNAANSLQPLGATPGEIADAYSAKARRPSCSVFILTRPFLSNFEGWVNNDIWDIPVYGTGFVGSITNPPGSPCTMQIIQQNGAVCASATTDVMGGTITFDSSGQLVTSKNGFYNGKPVAWACFNGSCIAGKPIAACNAPGNPITSVTVTCGVEVGIDHILGCPAQANPPSSVLGLSGMPAPAPAPAPAAAAPPSSSSRIELRASSTCHQL